MKILFAPFLSALLHSVSHRRALGAGLGLCVACILVACGAGGGNDLGGCDVKISGQPQALTAEDVERILARAVEASQKIDTNATIAVSDRVGNVLGVYRMNGARATVKVRSGRSGASGGLEEADVPAELAAIAKAITGAYLSSSGNAFSTRTASYIVQEHFVPGIKNSNGTPLSSQSGPLFGVQFSQLPCGDFVNRGDDVGPGPKRSPLGLSADPGGFPLYKNGRVVGGIGVVSDGIYGLDLDPRDFDSNIDDELIAQSASGRFAAPACIRADRISLGGPTGAYSDADGNLVSVSASTLADAGIAGSGSLIAVPGYIGAAVARAGTAYGDAASGFVAAQSAGLQARNAYVLVDAGNPVNRFAAASSPVPGNLSADEVTEILDQALRVANQARAQIRQPVGSQAQVSVSLVDTEGRLLGLARTPDAPVFGTDVSLQKARTAAFFSSPAAAASLAVHPQAGSYLTAAQSFVRPTVFNGDYAFSARAIGNLSRPLYPDGIEGSPNGPLSKPLAQWSPFNTGLQLDLVQTAFLDALNPANANANCTLSGGVSIDSVRNGIQIFPGGVPIYRGSTLIGAIGVSGDGVDQDDMIAALGLKRAGAARNDEIGNALKERRADQLSPLNRALRYVQCPFTPFLDSSSQNVCRSL